MRDPDGTLIFTQDLVKRKISPDATSLPYLHSKKISQLITKRWLLPFQITGPLEIQSRRIQFVSQPQEWCLAQLADAAKLTLEISNIISDDRFELKDASAWNVIFDGCHPYFCDYLSFTPTRKYYWWAMGQFVRHFTLPIALHRNNKLKIHQIFRMSRDGITPEVAKALLGFSKYKFRLLPFLIFSNNSSAHQVKNDVYDNEKDKHNSKLKNIYSFLNWSINYSEKNNKSTWSDYIENRSHYSPEQIAAKKTTITNWLNHISPKWVADIGCNTGEFSKLAVSSGANVIAADFDDECISRLYRNAQHTPALKEHLFPIVLNLSDMPGSSGAGGIENAGVLERIGAITDCVMLLGIMHHLSIAEAIPLKLLAKIFSRLTKKYAIIEMMEPEDNQVKLLHDQRNRTRSELTITEQLSELSEYFQQINSGEVIPGKRKLYLLELIKN